jgi:hypothetical protein
MNNRELALDYLRCFCDGNIDGIASLLAPELNFRGPLYSFSSAA